MATCMVEDSRLTALHCQSIDSMEQASTSALESINQQYELSFQIDSTTIMKNQDLIKRRQFHRSLTFTTTSDRTSILTDTSCLSQAVSTNSKNESMKMDIFRLSSIRLALSSCNQSTKASSSKSINTTIPNLSQLSRNITTWILRNRWWQIFFIT